MLSKGIEYLPEILKNQEFIHVASYDFSGRPNVAPKFLLSIQKNILTLTDYTIGRTYENLKRNPIVSMDVMDLETLTGYQINGPAELIEKGSHRYSMLFKVLEKRKIDFSVQRIATGVRTGKKHKGLELEFPDRVIFYRITIKEIVTIGLRGGLERENV